MKEIINKDRGPLQLMVRSKNKAVGFTTQILPGKGKGNHIIFIEDEEYTDQINYLKEEKLIVVNDLTRKQYLDRLNSN
jgi:hypothetical protein